MTEHSSIIGGSTAKRAMLCPASVTALWALPKTPAGEPAARGTRLHTVMSDLMSTGEVGPCSKEDSDLAQDMFNALEKHLSVNGVDSLVSFLVEQKVHLSKEIFGTADVIMKFKDRQYLVDWKFGQVQVSAEENDQLLFYAACALEGGLLDPNLPLELLIVQATPRPTVKAYVIDNLETVIRFKNAILDAVAEIKSDNPSLNPGKHCLETYCPFLPLCPKWQGVRREILACVDQMPDDLAPLLEAIESGVITQMINRAKALAQGLLLAGRPLKGWELTEGQGHRKICNEKAVVAYLKTNGVTDAYKTVMLTPSELKRKYDVDLPEELTTRPSTGLKLTRVKEDDTKDLAKAVRAALKK